MTNMDYDINQPKHIPIIICIIITIIFIMLMTFGLLLYFQGSLKSQESINELENSSSFNLQQLRQWENNYLNSTENNKVKLNDAIFITITRYNK
tara:strand:+ start:7605 stop:7886 length:282 start_codon:yes stop_codon:yes gene_type:complete